MLTQSNQERRGQDMGCSMYFNTKLHRSEQKLGRRPLWPSWREQVLALHSKECPLQTHALWLALSPLLFWAVDASHVAAFPGPMAETGAGVSMIYSPYGAEHSCSWVLCTKVQSLRASTA